MRYVVNASDINTNYLFFLPIINVIWHKYMGYAPVVVLVGEQEQVPAWLMSYIMSTSQVVINMKHIIDHSGAVVAQSSRTFVAAEPIFQPDDYILTSDADMIPLSHQFFNPTFTKTIQLHNANAYTAIGKDGHHPVDGATAAKFPLCYVGMPVSAWREVMNLETGSLQSEADRQLASRPNYWGDDEEYFIAKLKNSRFWMSDLDFLLRGGFDRGYADGRLDRSSWQFNGKTNGCIDCHFMRPGHKHSSELLRMLRAFFLGDVPYFQEYVKEFMAKVN